jgi:hypothetical protein
MADWSPDSESEVLIIETPSDCPLQDFRFYCSIPVGLFGGRDSPVEVEGLQAGLLSSLLGTHLLVQQLGK